MKEVAIKDICEKGSSSLKQKELQASGDYPVYGASGIAGYLNTYNQGTTYIGIVKDGSGIGRVDFYPDAHKNYSGMISTAYPLNTPPNPPKGGGY